MSSCEWGFSFEAMKTYHDTEWGIPLHDDQKQFEFLMMEAMQCGLSWDLMIKKREIFRSCFDGFDFDRMAAYDEAFICLNRIWQMHPNVLSKRPSYTLWIPDLAHIFANGLMLRC